MGYQNDVLQNLYVVSQSLDICISGCHIYLKNNYLWSEKARDFNLLWGIVVYSVEKSYVLMLSISEKSWDFKFSKYNRVWIRFPGVISETKRKCISNLTWFTISVLLFTITNQLYLYNLAPWSYHICDSIGLFLYLFILYYCYVWTLLKLKAEGIDPSVLLR
jgi:hypothetical protein